MTWRLGIVVSLAALLGGCANTAAPADTARPAGLTIGVGGSVGMVGGYTAPR